MARVIAVVVVCALTAGCGGSATVTRTVTQTSQAQPVQWSGNGTRSLGTITVPHDSTLRWTVSGGAILIGSDIGPGGASLNVGSQSPSGESAVQSGTYRNVQVISTGDWTLSIG